MIDLVAHSFVYGIIALLSLGSAVYLVHKARRTRNWVKVSDALPRFYLGILYIALILIELPFEQGRVLLRIGLLILLVIENLNHWFEWMEAKKA